MAATALAQEKVWFDKPSYDQAARLHFEKLAKVVADKLLERRELEACSKNFVTNTQETLVCSNDRPVNSSKKSKDKNNKAAKRYRSMKPSKGDNVDTKEQILTTVQQESQQSISPIIPASGSLANEIAKARQHIKKSLQCINEIRVDMTLQDVVTRFAALEKDNQELRNSVEELKENVKQLEIRVNANCPYIAICPAKPQDEEEIKSKNEDADDDVDLFGSDSEGEDAEAAKIREERLAAYAAKKSKKPVLIAKSNIILDVKPWDDETDMAILESEVRKIECDGLLWGAAKLVPLAYGIHKLQISCVVEDEKVSVDWLTEAIQEIEEYVQSVDIAAFNKV